MNTERWRVARGELEHEQWRKLQALLAAIVPANEFQARKLNPFGTFSSLTDFRTRCPFTIKTELSADQQTHPPYGTNLTFPVGRYTRCHQTSGSTGEPLRWLDTNESWSGLLDQWTQIYEAARVTAADRCFFAFSFGPFLGFWTAFEAAVRLGGLCIPGGGMSSATRLRVILANRATVLCCTPTYALRLAEVAKAEAIDLAGALVRLVIVAGEPGGSVPATREAISKAWNGARVFDHFGLTETGPVGHECFAPPGVLRVLEAAYLAEVIDPGTGAAVAPGVAGELVLTTLARSASPLLRYRTGDLVKALPPERNPDDCVELCLEGGILGRTDEMLLVRGVNVYPSAIEQLIRECGGIAEYRAEVKEERALAELELHIEPEPGRDAEAVRTQLERLVRERLTLRVPVKVLAPGSLPRFEMKARRWARPTALKSGQTAP